MGQKRIESLRRDVDRYLNEVLPSTRTSPVVLHRAMRYAVFPGGKRIRPILMLAVGEMVGGAKKDLLPAAAAVELIHAFSLVHDDLPGMDNDDMRRGRPTCHRVFGEGIAILAGDALLTLGFEVAAACGRVEVIRMIAQAIGSKGMAGGQAIDILACGSVLSGGAKKRLDRMKTGMLFHLCFELPLVFRPGRPSEEIQRSIRRLADDFGLAFQMRDDLEDGEGDARALQRQVAELRLRMGRQLAPFGERGQTVSDLITLLYGGAISR